MISIALIYLFDFSLVFGRSSKTNKNKVRKNAGPGTDFKGPALPPHRVFSEARHFSPLGFSSPITNARTASGTQQRFLSKYWLNE